MKLNTLGKTGLRVSALGLGGHEYRWLHAGNIADGRQIRYNPERVRVVARAREMGINYFDTTFFEEVQSLGHALAELGGRDEVIINGMVIAVLERVKGMAYAECERFIRGELETRLALLGSDHFDLFTLCGVEDGYERQRAQDVVGIYQRLREEGLFRFLGVSCHEYPVVTDLLAQGLPIDMVMFPYNYARAHLPGSGLEEMLAAARVRDLGLVAIKPLCWTMYGIPFTAINAEWHDAQGLIRHSVAWQTGCGVTHTTVIGVETVAELENDVAGAGMECDERLLAPYLEHHERLDLLVRHGLQHSREIQSRIAERCRQQLGCDLGDDLASYAGKVP